MLHHVTLDTLEKTGLILICSSTILKCMDRLNGEVSQQDGDEDRSADMSEYDPMFGIDLLLQASELKKEYQLNHMFTGQNNNQSPEPGIYTHSAPRRVVNGVSGIDLLIQAAELLDFRPKNNHSGISLLLRAAELLESVSAYRSPISIFQQSPFASRSASTTDASSSTSVSPYSGESVDVAIAWLEKHLANIERETRMSWLRDHTYIRPRPCNPRGIITPSYSSKFRGNASSSNPLDNLADVANGRPGTKISNNKNDSSIKQSEPADTHGKTPHFSSKPDKGKHTSKNKTSMSGSNDSTENQVLALSSRTAVTAQKRCSDTGVPWQTDFSAKKTNVHQVYQSTRHRHNKSCQTPVTNNISSIGGCLATYKRSSLPSHNVDDTSHQVLSPCCSTSSTSDPGISTVHVPVQPVMPERPNPKPVQTVRPVKRANQTCLLSTEPAKRVCHRPETRAHAGSGGRYRTRNSHQKQMVLYDPKRHRRLKNDVPKHRSTKKSHNDKPVAVVRPFVRSRCKLNK